MLIFILRVFRAILYLLLLYDRHWRIYFINLTYLRIILHLRIKIAIIIILNIIYILVTILILVDVFIIILIITINIIINLFEFLLRHRVIIILF